MADRGFTSADLLDTRRITLNIPPMKINEQFTEKELTTTHRIATLRIHVERVIRRIRNFKLLSDVSNNMARVVDQMFYVCAMLSNFHGPLCCQPYYMYDTHKLKVDVHIRFVARIVMDVK